MRTFVSSSLKPINDLLALKASNADLNSNVSSLQAGVDSANSLADSKLTWSGGDVWTSYYNGGSSPSDLGLALVLAIDSLPFGAVVHGASYRFYGGNYQARLLYRVVA